MREIKFRAWNKLTGEMIDLQTVTSLALSQGMNTQLAMKGDSGLFIPFMKDFPVMQFTGLRDRNGKEIYEKSEINSRYSVEYVAPKYVLTEISSGDIVDFKEGENYEITKEFVGINETV